MRPLTERQDNVLQVIRRHLQRRGLPPTRSELARELGLKSGASVVGHLTALERKGYIEILPETQRGIRVLTTGDVPILDTVYTCPDGEPLVTPDRIVANFPEILASGFSPYPHFLMVLGDNAPNMSILNPGITIAVRVDTELDNLDFHVVRVEQKILCRKIRRVGQGEIDLLHLDPNGKSRTDRVDTTNRNFAFEGAVVGHFSGFGKAQDKITNW